MKKEKYWIPFYGGHKHLQVEMLPLSNIRCCPKPLKIHYSEELKPIEFSFLQDIYELKEITWPGITDEMSRLNGEEVWEQWWIYVLHGDTYFMEEILKHWDLFVWMMSYGRVRY